MKKIGILFLLCALCYPMGVKAEEPEETIVETRADQSPLTMHNPYAMTSKTQKPYTPKTSIGAGAYSVQGCVFSVEGMLARKMERLYE